MTDVSCRAFSYFTVAAERGLLDLPRLLAGLPITQTELENPRHRVDWDIWAELCDRAAEQLGHDPRRLAESGVLVSETGERGFAGYVAPVASLFASTEGMFDIVTRWGGPSLYRSHTFELERLPKHKLRWRVRLRPGYRPCLAWFQMTPGALQAFPRMLGQPDTVFVTETITATEASFIITDTTSRTLGSRVRRTWAALRSSRAVSDELAFQERQLSGTLDTLRRTEGGFRSALDALPAYVALQRDDAIVYANPALRRAFDRAESALLGTPLTALIHADDRDRFARQMNEKPSPGRPPLLVRLAGDATMPRTVEVAPLPAFDFGGICTSGVIAIDVTDRIRVEETLSILHASLPDLVVRLASNGRLLDVQGGTNLAEQTRLLRALIGTRDWDANSALPGAISDHLSPARRALDRALETGTEQRTELTAEFDVPRTFELRVVPRHDGDEALMLIRDLTTQRNAERQLAISERMASVGTLAAGVAHEINNPLTYVMAGHEELDHELARLARGEAVDAAGLRAMLSEVSDGVGRIRDIVASLRAFSRIEPESAPVRLDPREAVQRALAMCANELRHRATLEVELGETPTVLANPSALIQVLVNLLINAAQAMPEDLRADRTIRVVTGTDEVGRSRIAVHDTGVGIPHLKLQRIFDPFYTTKPVGVGTGLGLSISHRLVNDLGGTISVTSEVGKGSVFVVALPPAPEAPPPTAAVADAEPNRARVLIIDDEPMVASALARILIRDGHACATANSASAALEHLRTRPFDLVLCDLMMPGTSGMEFYEQVSALDPSLAERFVFITGGAFTDAARALIEQGLRPVLPKPPDLAALRRTIAEALQRRTIATSTS